MIGIKDNTAEDEKKKVTHRFFAFPYAGPNRVRFRGCDLRPLGHP